MEVNNFESVSGDPVKFLLLNKFSFSIKGNWAVLNIFCLSGL